MPSTAAPFGFRPILHPSGSARVIELPGGIASAYANAIYKYSPVLLATDGTLQLVTSAADFIGVFMGCIYQPVAGARIVDSPFWPAAGTYVAGSMIAYYTSDPNIVYECQGAGSFAQTAIGDQADTASFTAGSTISGLSAATLGTVVGASSQGMWRIIGLANDVTNAWGDAFTNVQVQIARSQYVSNKVAI